MKDELGLPEIAPKDYLFDLRRAVCMIVKDGLAYHFAHRSFQTYFAAYYTASMPDERQKQLFSKIHSDFYDYPFYLVHRDFYTLLSQIEPERFGTNVLEKSIRFIQEQADNSEEPDRKFFQVLSGVHETGIFLGVQLIDGLDDERFSYGLEYLSSYPLFLFQDLISSPPIRFSRLSRSSDEAKLLYKTRKAHELFSYNTISKTKAITDEERSRVYDILIRDVLHIPETRAAIRHWLAELDRKRQSASSDSLEDF